jgi:starch phosphorylase
MRPVHVLAAEAGSDRAPEIAEALRSGGQLVRAHVLGPAAGERGGRERLRQEHAHVAEAVREALTDDGLLLLADERASLAVPEMMRVLLDDRAMAWDEAWGRVQGGTFARVGCPNFDPGPFWLVSFLEAEFPRLLEILYELNRRHLDAADARWPGDVERRRRVSLFQEGEEKRLCLGALTIVGSARAEVAAPWEGPVAGTLADLGEMKDGSLRPAPTPLVPRRWVREANPTLAGALTLALGDRWQREPEALADLEPLAFEAAFRGAFREARRANREALGRLLREAAGVETDPEALVDVRLGALHGRERPLLTVLGLVREHMRITAGGWTPPAPRTVVIAREAGVSGPGAERLLRVVRAVANVINGDERARPALRVAVLADCPEPTTRALAAGADLSNQPGTASSRAAGARAIGFAMNGAVTIGTRDGTVRELVEAVGAENLFLFGLSPLEARAWRDGRVYRPQDVYTIDPLVRISVDALLSRRYAPEPGAFDWVRQSLLDEHDPWLVLSDLGSYVHVQDEALAEFADPRTFTEKAILSVARCRRFWADRLSLPG